MKFRRTIASPCSMVLWAVVSLLNRPGHGQDVVKVTEVLAFAVEGTVTAQPAVISEASLLNKPAKKVSADEELLCPGGKLTTGADGATSVILGTSGTARMGQDTEILIPKEQTQEHSLEMLKGKLFLNISAEELKKRKAGEFRLKTPAALLAVKGTRFFAISQSGSDTIGVHEGSVAVQEPTSKTVVNVGAGQAVSVSPGQISPPRPLTDAEVDYKKEHELAMIVRTPLSLVVENSVQGLSKQPDSPSAQLFRDGRHTVLPAPAYSNFRGQTGCLVWPVLAHNNRMGDPKLSSDGTLLYSWPYTATFEDGVRLAAIDPYRKRYTIETEGPVGQTEFDLWIRDKSGGMVLGRVVAVQFRFRSSNVSKFIFKTRVADVRGAVLAPPLRAADGTWTQTMVQASPVRSTTIQDFGPTFLMIEPYHDGPAKKGASPRRGSATLEAADFVLFSLPK